nr:ADAMTS-like protein 1 [Halyomorpha halys]
MGFNKMISIIVILVVAVKCNDPLTSFDLMKEEEKELENLQVYNVEGMWSEWSPCSRTCDGGTSFQIRKCNEVNGCFGETLRYRLCNMQACPDGVEFRDQQCASFNQIPYEGQILEWSAYQGPQDDPCELRCIATTGLVATLAPQVQDGTRCKPGTLDLCVNGKCQRVGCDLVIGSEARVDICGVCGGDGSTCTQPLYHWVVEPASLCSVTCGNGYKMSQVLCRNIVTGHIVDSQLCDESQKPETKMIECNIHPCPAKWVGSSWSKCSVSCGGGSRSRTFSCMRKANSTLTKVPEFLCKGTRPREREPCNTVPCPPTWEVGPWSGCSVSCGEGVQTRSVTCNTSPYFSSEESSCDKNVKPDSTQSCTTGIPCNTGDKGSFLHGYLPFRPIAERLISEPVISSLSSNQPDFKPEPWGECSVSCGEGIRKRDVPCSIFLDFSQTFARVPDSYCQGPKPSTTEPCIETPCIAGNRMEAVRDGYSDPRYADSYFRSQNTESSIKVAPHQTGKTYVWKMQGYTHCSASCLGGVQESIIMCIQKDDEKVVGPFLCSTQTRPEALTRTCNEHPCPPRWNMTEFQQCSKPCGIGIQTREVHCIHEVTLGGGNTVVVPNHMCPQPQPIDRQQCNVVDCAVEWHTSKWSKCSKRCGGGVKRRTVECKQVMAQEHVVSRLPSQCPKNKPPEIRPCNTKPCPTEEQRPQIMAANQSYVQTNPSSREEVDLKIGGNAQIFHGSPVKIKCPVKKFDRSKIQWAKDHKLITSSRKYKISHKGALRIREASYGDTGVFTCLAGRSSADITINVKARPGDFPSSEEIEKQTHNQLDPGMHGNGDPPQRPFIFPGDDESHEQIPGEVSRKTKSTQQPKPVLPQQRSYTTTNSGIEEEDILPTPEEPDIFPPPTSSASRTLPDFHKILSNLQKFGGGRDQRMVRDDDEIRPESETEFPFVDSTEDSSEDIVVLGKGSPENLIFEWVISDWSACSKTCGGNGYQLI